MTQPGTGESVFDRYIAGCAFIHDDWDPHEGFGDWGQYDTNPFLLGADVCVVSTLRGFGEPYTAYLRELDSYPETVIIPEALTHDLTENLLKDPIALGELMEVVASKRLALSFFYPDRLARQYRHAFDLPYYTPVFYPSLAVFTLLNHKLSNPRLFEAARIDHPESCVCADMTDARAFVMADRAHASVVVKAGHRKNTVFNDRNEALAYLEKQVFPVLIETFYPAVNSPSANFFVSNGSMTPLFSTNQYISGYANWGNDSPARLPASVRELVVETTAKLAGHFHDLTGVIGIDYIQTEDGELLAVDINPRFCSPTYPFYFLQRLGVDLDTTFAHYRVIPCSLGTLSDVTSHPDFIPAQPGAKAGMMVYNPVVYDTPRPVSYLSYIVYSEDDDHLHRIEQTLLGIIRQ